MASHVETARTCYEAAEGFDPLARPERFLPAEDGHVVVLGRCVGVARETGVPFDAAFEENIAEHFELFDTICSATQDRQDALFDLLEQPLDVMVVIGGYNSSNTNNLAIISSERVHKSYYIASGDCIEGDAIRHKPAHTPLGAREEVEETAWLPDGPIRVGLTAGASTPNSQIGLTIGCILEPQWNGYEEMEHCRVVAESRRRIYLERYIGRRRAWKGHGFQGEGSWRSAPGRGWQRVELRYCMAVGQRRDRRSAETRRSPGRPNWTRTPPSPSPT